MTPYLTQALRTQIVWNLDGKLKIPCLYVNRRAVIWHLAGFWHHRIFPLCSVVVELHDDACYVVGTASGVGSFGQFPRRHFWFFFFSGKWNGIL